MSIFQHIRETRESKKREKEFKKEIERIKKLDDEKIKEKLPEVSSEDSAFIPELVKAMTDEQEKIQAISDEKVLKTFPNIKYEDTEGNIIWVKDILTNIRPYYYRLSPKFRLK